MGKKHLFLYLKEYVHYFIKTNNIFIFNKVSGLILTLCINFYLDFDMKKSMPLYLTFSGISIDLHLC